MDKLLNNFFFLSLIFSASVCQMDVQASSLGVEPLFLEVSPGQSAAIRVKNSSDVVSTVELLVHERLVDENGEQTRRPADDDFIVFPPLAAVPASSTQVFRIQSLLKDLAVSRSYFVTIRQVPVKLAPTTEPGARLRVVFAFDSAVHVVPRKAKADPKVVSANIDKTIIAVKTGRYETRDFGEQVEIVEQKEVPAVAITLRNDGNKYFYLQDYEYRLSGTDAAGESIDLPNFSVAEILDTTAVVLVPPGAQRTFKLPLSEAVSAQQISFTIKRRKG